MTTTALIEALLFSRAEPWTVGELGKVLGKDLEKIQQGIAELAKMLEGRGIVLVQAQDTLTLGTHPNAHAVLEKLFVEEQSKQLSKASIETLSIVMYGGDEVTRGKIDYIRGVNSGFILRTLMIRGLVERKPYARDRKRFVYTPTIALLSQMGATSVETLPEYARIHAELTQAAYGAEETIEATNNEGTLS